MLQGGRQCSKGEHSAILSTFIKLSFSIKTLVLSIFEWPLKTGFTVFFLELCPLLVTVDDGDKIEFRYPLKIKASTGAHNAIQIHSCSILL